MFRKSVLFFVLMALLWIMLWSWIPDITPNKLSFSDFFRSILLLFALMAISFAGLILLVRYKGIDIATNFIPKFMPQAGIIMWLGKHAYEFSQPKIILSINYIGQFEHIEITIETQKRVQQKKLFKHKIETIKLDHIDTNPTLSSKQFDEPQVIDVIDQIKKIGKNFKVVITITDDGMSYQQIK